MFSDTMSVTETIQLWGIIISLVVMLATVLQVLVTYLISRSLQRIGEKSEAMNASRLINSQWQEFNTLVVTNSEFRKSLIALEKFEESDEEIQMRYIIFFKLNVIHTAFAAKKSLGISEGHLETTVSEMLGTLKHHRDVVLSILDGSRGYDDDFIAECKKQLLKLEV